MCDFLFSIFFPVIMLIIAYLFCQADNHWHEIYEQRVISFKVRKFHSCNLYLQARKDHHYSMTPRFSSEILATGSWGTSATQDTQVALPEPICGQSHSIIKWD